jgi:uncharacterized membrane protein
LPPWAVPETPKIVPPINLVQKCQSDLNKAKKGLEKTTSRVVTLRQQLEEATATPAEFADRVTETIADLASAIELLKDYPCKKRSDLDEPESDLVEEDHEEENYDDVEVLDATRHDLQSRKHEYEEATDRLHKLQAKVSKRSPDRPSRDESTSGSEPTPPIGALGGIPAPKIPTGATPPDGSIG